MISFSFLNFRGFDIFNSEQKYQQFSCENVCKRAYGAFSISRSSYRGKCIPEIFQVAQAENPKSQTPQMFIVRVPTDSDCNSAVNAIKTERALEEFPPKQVTLSLGKCPQLVSARGNPALQAVFQSPADGSGQTEQHNDMLHRASVIFSTLSSRPCD